MAQPAGVPGPPPPAKKLPGMAGIWIGIVLIVVGIAVGIALVVAGAQSLVHAYDDLQRIPVNGGGTVEVTKAGTQSVYAERRASGSGTSFSSGTSSLYRPDIRLDVESVSTGASIPVVIPSRGETYTSNGREGVLIATFYADPGEYRVRSVYADGTGDYIDLAVGKGIDVGGVVGILGGVFGGGAIVLVGIIVLIISAVRRGRARRAATPYGPGPGGGAPLAGWAPPPVTAPGVPYGSGGSAGWPPAAPAPVWTPPGTPGAPPAAAPGAYPPASYPPPPAYPPAGQGWAPPPPPGPAAPSPGAGPSAPPPP